MVSRPIRRAAGKPHTARRVSNAQNPRAGTSPARVVFGAHAVVWRKTTASLRRIGIPPNHLVQKAPAIQQ